MQVQRNLLLEGVSKGLSCRRQSAEHELDHGDVDPGLRGCAQGLVVLAPPSAPAQPGAGARPYPSALTRVLMLECRA